MSSTSWPTTYAVAAFQGVSLKLVMHPVGAQTLGTAKLPAFAEVPSARTLANTHSVAPPGTLGFKMSVTGEHGVVMLERTGPGRTAPRAPAVTATLYRIGGPPVLPQTQRFPVPFTEFW